MQYNSVSKSYIVQNPVEVVKSDVEGELKIKKVILLRELVVKKVLFFLITVFCSDRPNVLRKVHYEEVTNQEDATHVFVQASDLSEYIEPASMKENPEDNNQKSLYFKNRYQHYMYSFKQNAFKAIELPVQAKSYTELANTQPLPTNRIDSLLQYYGKSEIDIKVPSFLHLMWVEYKKPINFLLYYGVVVWAIEMMVVSVAITVVFTTTINSLIIIYIRGVMKKLQKACIINTDVIVQRNNGTNIQEITIPCNMLVPGDIVFIRREMVVPFDCLVLEGSCQVNEANITGENVGIGKCQIPTDHHNDIFKYESSKSHILYQGTNLIKIEDEQLKVLVVRSGFGSYKGQIIRALLYPKPFDKKFQNQCVKLTVLMTIILFIGYLACLFNLIKIELPPILIFYRFLDIGIYSAPPAMPLLVAITNFVGLYRLKNNKILGQDPATSSQAGRIQTLCFDKTGTLTEDKVDLIGYQRAGENEIIKTVKLTDPNNISIEHKLFSICHEVTKVNGKFDGDSMDIRMVEFGKLDIEYDHSKKQHYSLSGNKRFYAIQVNQFHSEYQSMSIICKEEDTQSKETKHFFFIKGSPEKIQSLSETSQEEKKQLAILTNEGYRILGFAYKEIPNGEIEQFLDLSREQQEQKVKTLGFLIYKNNLKSDTYEIIKEFREALYNIKVISGDNPITTLKISQELEIVKRTNSTILINFEDSENVKSHLTISEIKPDNSINVIDFSHAQNENDLLQKQINYCTTAFLNNCSFCFSGKAHYFFQLRSKTDHISFKPEWLQKQDSHTQKIVRFYQMLIISSNIFARTQPEQKQTIVRLIKESNFVVCMVGDGANDCSAIREADVGISFAEADGQFSSSYVSLGTSLDCVKQVLLEGRVNLSNSVEIFKGYTQIALMRYVGFLALANFYSSYSSNQMDWQAFGSGYFLVYLFLGLNKPLKTLKKNVFDDNLFGIYNTSTVLFAFFVHCLSVLGCLVALKESDGYQEHSELDKASGTFFLSSQHNTVLNFNILIHFFYALIANHIGKPMKERYWKNPWSYLFIWGQFLHANAMIFTSSAYPGPGLEYVELPSLELKVKVFLISNGCGLIHFLFEHFFTRRIFARLFERAYERNRAQQMQSILNDISQQNVK